MVDRGMAIHIQKGPEPRLWIAAEAAGRSPLSGTSI
jgi:hypothetical protein